MRTSPDPEPAVARRRLRTGARGKNPAGVHLHARPAGLTGITASVTALLAGATTELCVWVPARVRVLWAEPANELSVIPRKSRQGRRARTRHGQESLSRAQGPHTVDASASLKHWVKKLARTNRP